jgi:hypothetical protein
MYPTYTIGRVRYFTARVASPRHDPGMSQRQFLLGEVELAAFAAMREVEIRVREVPDAPSPPQEEPPTEE